MSVTPLSDLYLESDNTVAMRSVTDYRGNALTAGSGTWALLNEDLTPVTGSPSGAMTNPGADNNYYGEIDASLLDGLTVGNIYYVKVQFIQAGFKKTVWMRCRATRELAGSD